MLTGYRTYITGALIAIVAFAKSVGWVTPEMADSLTDFLVGGGLVFLRLGMTNETKK